MSYKSHFEDSLYPNRKVDRDTIVYDRTRVFISSRMLADGIKNITFVDSNVRYMRILDDIDLRKEYLFYIDFSNNERVVNTVSNILRKIVKLNYKNIIVIFIPCIEYYMIESFADKNNDLVQNVLSFGDYTQTKVYENNMPKHNKSFERYCKALSSIVLPRKYLGSVEIGKYSISKEDSIKLIESLPVFDCDEINGDVIESSVQSVCDSYINVCKPIMKYTGVKRNTYVNFKAEYSMYVNLLRQNN